MLILDDSVALGGGQLKVWGDSRVLDYWNVSRPSPLNAKALYVFGLMLQNIEAARKLITRSDGQLYADFMVQAFLMSANAIEVLGCCLSGTSVTGSLKKGFEKFLEDKPLTVNIPPDQSYQYTVEDLITLRNFVGHGQKEGAYQGKRSVVRLHIELLDSFPGRFGAVLDKYLDDLKTKEYQELLAKAEIYPHYILDQGLQNHLFMPPHVYAYKILVNPPRKPSQFIGHKEWNIYKDINRRGEG